MDENLVILIISFVVLGIPIMAFSARFALKPMVDAVIRLREAFVPQGGGANQERRLAAIEAELAIIRGQMERLEGTAFVKELQRGPIELP